MAIVSLYLGFVSLLPVQELLEVVDEMKGRFIVTSDHGNADDMAQVGG